MAGIKGTAIESVVADVRRLVEEGRLSRDELEARLTAADLALLGEKILAAVWYPLGALDRLTQVLLVTEGRGSIAYLVERGARAAERVRDAGIYAQFGRNRDALGDRVGQVMVTLGPAMFQDTQWSFRYEPPDQRRRARIEVFVPAEFPEVARHTSQGFIEKLATIDRQGRVRVRSERTSPTAVTFFLEME